MEVKNLQHLKELANNENGDFEDFYIVLANGLAKSSKRILYSSELDEFSLIHEIDESYQEFNSSEIGIKTNLISAINAKSLFKG
ncbi:hypothetical protein [Cellulophaga omnivescoria]|uniref:hypothetical protein n=1 Tax=Cellulophaga omnivescoria TaxID=1888890 RepID=UPI0022F1256E|nr:hypothetical protein [Cellulophaga omnivescoria]WBU90302.1 hypothetical protein PBN93_04635 [Cellulophaga omnivescoria]